MHILKLWFWVFIYDEDLLHKFDIKMKIYYVVFFLFKIHNVIYLFKE